MKKTRLFIIFPLLFHGCIAPIGEGFEMTYIQDFQILSGFDPINTHVFEFNNIDSQKDFFFDNHGSTTDEVNAIVPKSFRITALAGNFNFSILERIRVFLVKADGTLESEIAFMEPVPLDAGFELILTPTLADVEEHLEEGTFTLKIKLNFRESPNQSIDARLDYRFQAVIEE